MLPVTKILVVDDEDIVCQSYRRVLEADGHDMSTATTGEEALGKIAAGRFDVVLLDLKIPGSGGLHLLRAIRRVSPRTEVVVITGYPSVESAKEAIRFGAFDVVTKPLVPNELRRMVSQVLACKLSTTHNRGAEMVTPDKRILVVDDEQIVRESYKRALTDAGYTVRTVESGLDALKACRAEPFDVMLADLRMPGMDGIDVAKAVTDEFPETRVVIITGYPSRQSAERAASLGIFDYLEKPLSPERLSQATAAVLERPARRMPTMPQTPLADPALAKSPSVDLRKPEQHEPAEVAEPVGERSGQPAVRKAVLISVGFLVGVTVAYIIAPSQGLAYLAVGTAIASGTILGLFSDALFAKTSG